MAEKILSTAKTPSRLVLGWPTSSLKFDYLLLVATYWFLAGSFIDGWAHNHGQADESFFTPWHAVLYMGVFSVGVVLGVTQLRNMLKGHQLFQALPKPYLPAFVGVFLFFVAGGLDLGWHTLFGIEANIEALNSPTHLLLAGSGLMFITAPIRAAWERPDSKGWKELLPALLALAGTLSIVTFFSQYANFVSRPLTLLRGPMPDPLYGIPGFTESAYGVFSVLAPTMLTMGFTFFAMRRWSMPFGSITLMLTINAGLMTFLKWQYISPMLPAMISVPIGGLLLDVLIWRLKPSFEHPAAMRVIAFVGPFTTALIYLLALNWIGQATFGGGLWWKIHMWAGVPVIVGCAGVLLSLLAAPPPMPQKSMRGA